VIVADGETGEGADAERESATGPARIARADGLIALAQALNAETRAALVLLRGGGNRTGPDAVLTWATGYPMAVDFARGAPRYRPRDGSASTLLARGRVDAALVVGALDRVPAVIQAGLHAVRTVVVGPRASEWAGSSIAIDTPVAGIGETGTALRMDDIPLPVRALVSGPPAATEVLRALTARIVETISP
jgi:formylmethanofuran dehydrogenase subunit B